MSLATLNLEIRLETLILNLVSLIIRVNSTEMPNVLEHLLH